MDSMVTRDVTHYERTKGEISDSALDILGVVEEQPSEQVWLSRT